jgi:UDP-4-amino-4,6-dideoxy-N-acetyl-beta-L-altrosamine transaminase
MIPYATQEISDQDVDAVVEVLRSDWLTQGPAVERFEQSVARYCGASHAVAVSSGTSALHLSCRALGLGPGDILWTSPNTFVASANCALYCGAKVDFVDIDPHTYNMSVTALEEKLEKAASDGCLPKVIVAVHFAGQPCDMKGIRELADRYQCYVIEDASHAIGATYEGVPTGQCQHSDLTIFSFHPVKVLTTGEGGLISTNRSDLIEKLILLRSHGITRKPRQMVNDSEGGWYYEQVDLGYNYRMTDIQAALGTSQIQRLDSFLARRRQLVSQYNKLLADVPVILPHCADYCESAWHLYVVRIDPEQAGKGRSQVFKEMRENGVGVNVHYIPVHLQPYYRKMGFSRGDFPCAENYYKDALSLPLYTRLSDEDQHKVVRILDKAAS